MTDPTSQPKKGDPFEWTNHAFHGTESGYTLHRYREETPCDACKEAHAEYQKAYYRRPGVAEKSRQRSQRQKYAQQKLRQLHPEVWDELIKEIPASSGSKHNVSYDRYKALRARFTEEYNEYYDEALVLIMKEQLKRKKEEEGERPAQPLDNPYRRPRGG